MVAVRQHSAAERKQLKKEKAARRAFLVTTPASRQRQQLFLL